MQTNKLTNEDLEALGQLMGGLLDKQTAVLATKEELKDLKTELKDYMGQGFEMVMGGMDAFVEKLDVRDRVDKLEQDVSKLKTTH